MGIELDKVFNACNDKSKRRIRDSLTCAPDVTLQHEQGGMEIHTQGFLGIPWEVQLGITLSPSVINERLCREWVRLQRCGLPIWQGASNINAFCDPRSQANCHSSIWMDSKNLKGSSCFWFKFAHDSLIIFEHFLTNCVVKIYMLFIGAEQFALTDCSLRGRIVSQFARSGMLRNISWEKASPPDMACNVVETVESHACIAVARASSTSSSAVQYIYGGWTSNSVFNTDATVWCIRLQMALECGFLFVVGMDFMLNTLSRCWKAMPVNLPPLTWMTCIGLGY